MIHELKKTDHSKVQKLFDELQWNLIIKAVIDGTSPGRIYVDSIENPRTAFICTVEGYYIAGNAGNDEFNCSLNRLIFERLFTGDTVRKDETDLAIGFYPDSWKSKMPTIFQGRVPLTTGRRHYVCTEVIIKDWKKKLPPGFGIRRIDEDILKGRGFEIPEQIDVETNWGSISDFLQKGFGFCTLHGKKAVSWSTTDCVSGNRCEIGIYTCEDHRRQGLATLTTAAIVDYALSYGFSSVGWHCGEYNLPSIRTAEKAGFKLERKYVQYYICCNEAHHLEETAQFYFRAKRYKEAIESYEKFFATPKEKLPDWFRKILPQELGVHYFRIALSKAAIGENKGALEYLKKAVDNGWLHIDFLKNCKEFESMHGTPAWSNILTKIWKKLDTRRNVAERETSPPR